jgi:hypothetical protein
LVVEETEAAAVALALQLLAARIGCGEQMASAGGTAEVHCRGSDRNNSQRDSSLAGCGDDSQLNYAREDRILGRITGMSRD